MYEVMSDVEAMIHAVQHDDLSTARRIKDVIHPATFDYASVLDAAVRQGNYGWVKQIVEWARDSGHGRYLNEPYVFVLALHHKQSALAEQLFARWMPLRPSRTGRG